MPKLSLPSFIKIVSLEPAEIAFKCEVVFPSICLNLESSGNAVLNPMSRSCKTSGSAFSLIITPAVVWGIKTVTVPSFIADSVRILRISSVISTNSTFL